MVDSLFAARDREGSAGTFRAWVRRAGVWWVLVTVPLVTAASSLVDSVDGYVLVFVLLGSGLYTTPALVAGLWAALRSPARDRAAGLLWCSGLGVIYAIGLGMAIGAVTGWVPANAAGVPAVVLAAVLLLTGNARFVRTGSGQRSMAVDVLDCVTSIVAIAAPGVLLWGEAVASSDARWYTLPAAVATIGMVAGLYWIALLVWRRGRSDGPLAVYLLGFMSVGAIDAAVQTAHGVSGFTLAVSPLIALHATAMGLLLLVALYWPRELDTGLSGLAPEAQVRGDVFAPALTIAAVPGLLVAAATVDHARTWAAPFCIGAVTVLLALAVARHAVAMRETRRLYADVRETSAARQDLLDAMVRLGNRDRQQATSALHTQAVSAYASVRSLGAAMRPTAPPPPDDPAMLVGEQLARRADALRELLLATRSVADSGGDHSLATVAEAHVAGLYRGRRPPRLTIGVPEELVLDWATHTVLLGIVEEALTAVRHHARATAIDVTVEAEDTTVVLNVTFDGVAADSAGLPASRVDTISAYASCLGGELAITTGGDRATVCVTLDLAAPTPNPPAPPPFQRRLRVVPDAAAGESGVAERRARPETR